MFLDFVNTSITGVVRSGETLVWYNIHCAAKDRYIEELSLAATSLGANY